jgi:prophage tail gpP-like protein
VLRTTEPSDEVTVTINGTELRFWNEVTLTTAVDAFSTFTLNAPFDHTSAEHRELFRPLRSQEVVIKVDGETLFTGTVVTVVPSGTPNENSVTLSGYSKAGALVDSSMPDGQTRVFNDVPLSFIAQHIAEAFGLKMTVLFEHDPPFANVEVDIDTKALEILTDLAQQRNAVITDDVDGNPIIWVPDEGAESVALIGAEVASRVEPQINGQKYFKHIYGYTPTNRKRGRVGEIHAYENPLAPAEVTRAHFFKIQDTDNEDAPAVMAATIGKMFGETAQWNLPEVPSWRDPKGALWECNTKITLHAPQLMIYSQTDFLIRSVTLHATPNTRTADLSLVLPGVFSGVTPDKWPFDEPSTPSI